MLLRPYQAKNETDIYTEWGKGHKNVCSVTPTGGGKTVIFSKISNDFNGFTAAIAHRQELVGQMSVSLARFGVRHRIIAPKNVIKFIVQQQVKETGNSFYDPSGRCTVAGVDTLLRRTDEFKSLLPRVGLWIMDEGHHVLRENKWGKAVDLFPNAYGLGVTANTIRADGKGIGRHAQGVFDSLVHGPSMRELIDDGYLCDYRIICPPSDIDVSQVNITAAGDYNQKQLKQASEKSHIVGDVVDHYLKFAAGKLGITFVTDTDTAAKVAKQFNDRGVPAAVLTAKTPDKVRVLTLERFRRREILQLVNVDLFGEGFDLPAIEVVSLARPTESVNLFDQQFGRALRPIYAENMPLDTREQRLTAIAASFKPKAIIIDHVGNIIRHGLPDGYRLRTLDARDKRAKKEKDPNEIPLRVCANPLCNAPYEAVLSVCPFCGEPYAPEARTAPEFVDGDLYELDADTLAVMRGEIAKIDRPAEEIKRGLQKSGLNDIAAMGAAKQHRLRQEAQDKLRESIALWAGVQRAKGRSESESYKRFYYAFGIDVLTAQTLGRPDAESLNTKIQRVIYDAISK